MEVLILDDGSTDDTIYKANASIAMETLRQGHTFRVVPNVTAAIQPTRARLPARCWCGTHAAIG
ncbi:MAG: hypothetical protein LH470_07975 [Lysobacter sp.]|nr:hypothetical protein [Lysobacter sp.]